MVIAFIMGACTTGIIMGLGGYLLGSKTPDFQERAVEYAYEKQHENCVYNKNDNCTYNK